MAVNRARGEAAIQIDGKERRLCLTLGALAEMEAAFAASSLQDLAERLRSLSARDLLCVLASLLRGGGEAELAGELSAHAIDLVDAANAIADCFGSLT